MASPQLHPHSNGQSWTMGRPSQAAIVSPQDTSPNRTVTLPGSHSHANSSVTTSNLSPIHERKQSVSSPFTMPVPPSALPTRVSDDDWQKHIDPELLSTISKDEQRRQHHMFEIIQNQTNYTNDLLTVHMLYYEPMLNQDIIEENKRFGFVWDVFGPFEDLLMINRRLLQLLLDRQVASNYVINQIADIFIDMAQDFDLYEYYGENSENSTAQLKAEIRKNPKLKIFLDGIMKSYDKIQEVNAYLTNIIKRFSDYKLNLTDVLKRTAPTNPDAHLIPKAISMLNTIGSRMNAGAKRTQIRRKMQYLKRRLKPDSRVDLLRLDDPSRELLYETRMTVKRTQDHNITLFLFDHYLVMAKTNEDLIVEDDEKEATMQKSSYAYQVYKDPIPLDLLNVAKSLSASSPSDTSFSKNSKLLFYVSYVDVRGTNTILAFSAINEAARDQWVKKITEQKNTRAHNSPILVVPVADSSALSDDQRVISCAKLSHNVLMLATPKSVLIGTIGSAWQYTILFKPVLSLEDITQIDVMEDLDLLLVLSGKSLLAFTLQSLLLPQAPGHISSKGRKIAENVTFFKVGNCDGKRLVCAVASYALRWDIKLIDPTKERKKNMFSKAREMEIFKEFVIPTRVSSINFLKSRVVLGCTKGFEMVHLSLVGAAANSPLLDQNDQNLALVLGRDDLNPIGLFRTSEEGDYLLCFQDVGFYVNRNGRRTRLDLLFRWRSSPASFAYFAPYVIAFGSSMYEIYHAQSGELVHAVAGTGFKTVCISENNLWFTRESTQEGQVLCHVQLKIPPNS